MVNQKFMDKCKEKKNEKTFISDLCTRLDGKIKSLFEQSMSDMNFIRFFLVGHHPGNRACDS